MFGCIETREHKSCDGCGTLVKPKEEFWKHRNIVHEFGTGSQEVEGDVLLKMWILLQHRNTEYEAY